MEKMTMKLLREKQKLSQRQLGDLLGVTDQTVSNWENHVYDVKLTPKQTVKLCQALQVSVGRLAEILDEEKKKDQ